MGFACGALYPPYLLARGPAEDITGVVTPALLLTRISSIVAIVAGLSLRRCRTAGRF